MENNDDGPKGEDGLSNPEPVDSGGFSSGTVRAATGAVIADGVDGTADDWVEKGDFVTSAGFCPNRLNPLVPVGFLRSVGARGALTGSTLGWPKAPNVMVGGFCSAGSAASVGFCPKRPLAGKGDLELSAGF